MMFGMVNFMKGSFMVFLDGYQQNLWNIIRLIMIIFKDIAQAIVRHGQLMFEGEHHNDKFTDKLLITPI